MAEKCSTLGSSINNNDEKNNLVLTSFTVSYGKMFINQYIQSG